jgi:hypothetical protein
MKKFYFILMLSIGLIISQNAYSSERKITKKTVVKKAPIESVCIFVGWSFVEEIHDGELETWVYPHYICNISWNHAMQDVMNTMC